MTLKLLMGNEAIAYGAAEAGVQVATAYPGTPSSEVLSTLANLSSEKGFYAEWSVNEKVALETAAGAAYAGARSLAAMKQVGLNVASDPLMSLAYIGVKGGLVLVVADDPGPHSSQTEQDTRLFARFAKLPVLDPATPREAKEMTMYAFELSEKLSLPVILRPTTRTCHACQDIEIQDGSAKSQPISGFQRSPDWVIFPNLSARKHVWLNGQQEAARVSFESSSFNQLTTSEHSDVGIIACGVSYNYCMEALQLTGLEASVLKIGTPYPLPAGPVLKLLQQSKKILVIEEQEPVVEDQVAALAWKNRSTTIISGKNDGLVPREGELNVNKVRTILENFFGRQQEKFETAAAPELPLRTPVLCAGCSHRASFYILKEAARGNDTLFAGDIGCYTLGAMAPLYTTDTCLCMGASTSIAAGLSRVEPHRKQVAFLGDSTFFHSGIPGLINAVHNSANITLVILDNSTTAMTGHQPHPGLNRTALGPTNKVINIERMAEACGAEFVRVVDPFDLSAALQVAKEALAFDGVSVLIMQRECIAQMKKGHHRRINPDQCTGCGACIDELGCPAIGKPAGTPEILDNCFGCGFCDQVCPVGAIEEVE